MGQWYAFACLRADYGRSLVVSYCIKMLRRAFCSHVPVEDHHGMFRSTGYSHISDSERAFKHGATTGFLHLLYGLAHLLDYVAASQEMDADAIPSQTFELRCDPGRISHTSMVSYIRPSSEPYKLRWTLQFPLLALPDSRLDRHS